MFTSRLFGSRSGGGGSGSGGGGSGGGMPVEVLKRGELRKRGRMRRNWLARCFVLTPTALRYYKGQSYPAGLKGSVELTRRSAVLYVQDQVGVCVGVWV